jgi:hypothetical protein
MLWSKHKFKPKNLEISNFVALTFITHKETSNSANFYNKSTQKNLNYKNKKIRVEEKVIFLNFLCIFFLYPFGMESERESVTDLRISIFIKVTTSRNRGS